MTVRKSDLTDLTGAREPLPFLHCRECGSNYSAHKLDYWDVPATHGFTCCDQPMILAIKKVTLQRYRNKGK